MIGHDSVSPDINIKNEKRGNAFARQTTDGDVQRILRYIYLHRINKRDEHSAKYSDNKVYQIVILVIGEIE